MKYKAVLLDIDGTLVNSKKELSDKNKETLIKVQEAGIKVVLATGRPTYGVMPIANELRLEEFGGYVLSYNGGTIWECSSSQPIFQQLLPLDYMSDLYESAKNKEVELISYDQEVILSENSEDIYVQKEAFLNKMEVKKVDSIIDSLPLEVPKCLVVGEPNKLIELEVEYKEKVGNEINVYRSEPFFLELVPPGIDKAASIERLMNQLGIHSSETMAFGDGFNDLTMVEWSGFGVAMGNAQEPVKAIAQHIAPTNDQDGVAVVLEEKILQRLS